MNTAARILGNHAFFFRDGDAFTVPAAGIASRTAKPGADDPVWIDFGVINNVSVSHERSEIEIYTPSPGQLRLYDVLETKRKLGIKFECEEIGALAVELIFGAGALNPASTNYNPLAGTVKKGWLKIQQYDQADQLVNTVDAYVHIKVAGETKFDDSNVKPAVECMVLHSGLNAGSLVA
jgi:hypothetical protein